MDILASICPQPGSTDLESWARGFILSPARTARDRRDRRIVAQLLADLEASR